MAVKHRRTVAGVAVVNPWPARMPSARDRLCASAARISQALFAPNRPEVIWSHSRAVQDVHHEGW